MLRGGSSPSSDIFAQSWQPYAAPRHCFVFPFFAHLQRRSFLSLLPPQLDHTSEKAGIRTVLGNCELSKADNRPSYASGQSDFDQLLVQLERSADGPPTAGLVTQPFQTFAKDIRCMLAQLGPTQSKTWIGSIRGLDWVGKWPMSNS